MEKIDKAIEILQAFKEGKTVQYLECSKWRDFIEGNIFSVLSHYICRIKPQLTYRPYANAEEFLKASKEHGPYIWFNKHLNSSKYLTIPLEIWSGGVDWDGENKINSKWDELVNCTWQDGHPCGILEE